jgi:hypothetical protein
MKKIIFTLLVLLSFSAANASLRYGSVFYDFMENGIAYNILDSTAKKVEVTYDLMPGIYTAPRTTVKPIFTQPFAKISGEANSISSSSIMKASKYRPYDSIASLTIPSEVAHNGVTYNVVGIGDYTFWENPSLDTLTIPSSVKVIGDYVFCNNSMYSMTSQSYTTNIKTVIIPEEGLDSINEGAFAVSELKTFHIPKTVKVIERYAFLGCRSLGPTIEIPDSVKKLPDAVFNGCVSIEKLTIVNCTPKVRHKTFEVQFYYATFI